VLCQTVMPQNLTLPTDAVHWRGTCYGDVAVCLSVMLMYRAQTNESIITRPSPDCSPDILALSYQIYEHDSLTVSSSMRAPNGRRVRKSWKIRPINHRYSPDGSA